MAPNQGNRGIHALDILRLGDGALFTFSVLTMAKYLDSWSKWIPILSQMPNILWVLVEFGPH